MRQGWGWGRDRDLRSVSHNKAPEKPSTEADHAQGTADLDPAEIDTVERKQQALGTGEMAGWAARRGGRVSHINYGPLLTVTVCQALFSSLDALPLAQFSRIPVRTGIVMSHFTDEETEAH